MGALTTWKATLYGSNTDTAATTFDTIYQGYMLPISSLTAAANVSWFITGPQLTLQFDTNVLQDVSGDAVGFLRRRLEFEIVSWPFDYNATSATDAQDLDDYVTVTNLLATYKYFYLRIDGGSRSYPSAGNVYPVVVSDSPTTNINFDQGTRQLVIRFRHRRAS